MSEVKKDIKKSSEFDKLWSRMKKAEMEIFGLPNQVVENYFQEYSTSEDVLILKLIKPGAMAAIPALESLLSVHADPKHNPYIVETAENMLVEVKRNPTYVSAENGSSQKFAVVMKVD